MMRSVLFLLGLLAAGIASAQSVAALGDLTFAADADHFDIFRARAGGLFNYKSYLDYIGVAAQDTHYSQSGWSRDAPGVIGVWRNQRRDTLAGVNAEAGVVRIGARPRFVADATWGLRPLPGTGVELIAARDLVETQRALDRGTTYGFLGASVEQTIIDRLTVVGLAAYQPFSDGNERVHLRARLIWDVLPEQGITAQLRWRQYHSHRLDVGGGYFNPERYDEWQAGIGVRKRVEAWLVSGLAAGGREYIKDGEDRPTWRAELRAEGPLAKDVRLSLRALYTRSAGLFVNTSGYWYSQLIATIIVPF